MEDRNSKTRVRRPDLAATETETQSEETQAGSTTDTQEDKPEPEAEQDQPAKEPDPVQAVFNKPYVADSVMVKDSFGNVVLICGAPHQSMEQREAFTLAVADAINRLPA